ncbi:hypothetical protein FOMPIDRAFT_114286 [Fomitopsis schrenkii]|uniref:BTB domain-containing protein n=1 Tax=Fomitopsis schrenkii TaxID=2126942 RepID=S8FDR5_FOMSC|nr:hypothetical protein FOMPIDRAFT_114286 [Fomitopsis schrenkii]
MPKDIEMHRHSIAASSKSPKRHARFYLNDGNVVFLAGNVLFNVHKFLRQESPVFADMFSLQSDEGTSDEKPILLEGTTYFQFESFLSCIYPSRIWKLDGMPFESWASVLQFSAKWQFDAIRDIATEHLRDVRTDAPTLARQIALAKTQRLDSWYQEACLKMCERGLPLTEEEAELLDKKEIVWISTIRQFVRASRPGTRGYPEDQYAARHTLDHMHRAAKSLAPAP